MSKPGDRFQMGVMTVQVACKHILDWFPDGVIVDEGWTCANCEQEKAMTEEKLAELEKLTHDSDDLRHLVEGLKRDSVFLGGIGDPFKQEDQVVRFSRKDSNLSPTTVAFLEQVQRAVGELIAEVRGLNARVDRLEDQVAVQAESIFGWESFSLAAAGYDPDKYGLLKAQAVARDAALDEAAQELRTMYMKAKVNSPRPGETEHDVLVALNTLSRAVSAIEDMKKAPSP